MTYISIHDISEEDYEKLGQEEKVSVGGLTGTPTTWKGIETPTVRITFFKPRNS